MSRREKQNALVLALADMVEAHGLDAVLVEIAEAYNEAADAHDTENVCAPAIERLRDAVRRMGAHADPAEVMRVHADITVAS